MSNFIKLPSGCFINLDHVIYAYQDPQTREVIVEFAFAPADGYNRQLAVMTKFFDGPDAEAILAALEVEANL
jgi:hypothetical protein